MASKGEVSAEKMLWTLRDKYDFTDFYHDEVSAFEAADRMDAQRPNNAPHIAEGWVRADRYDELRRLAEAVATCDEADGLEFVTRLHALRAYLKIEEGGTERGA